MNGEYAALVSRCMWKRGPRTIYRPARNCLLRDNFENPDCAFANAGERVRHEWVQSGVGNGQFNYHAAARGNRHRLIAHHVVRGVSIYIGIAEDSSDNVECREQGRASIHNEDAYALTCLCHDGRGLVLVDITIEDHVVRVACI